VDGVWAVTTQGRLHDFWFTGESHSYFQFPATGMSLQAYGADDIFIFINGKLVLDLGGTHEPIGGKVVIDTTGNANIVEGGFLGVDGEVLPCPSGDPRDPMNTKGCPRPVTGDDCRARLVPLGLKPGSVNENHAASWFSVRTSTSSGDALARGSESKRRRMASSAIASLNGCSPGARNPSTAWSRARMPVESHSCIGVASVRSAS
jgi:fibro-slime domain-containing protein